MAEPPGGDVLVSGGDREAGDRWRRLPRPVRTALLVLGLLTMALAAIATGVGRSEPGPATSSTASPTPSRTPAPTVAGRTDEATVPARATAAVLPGSGPAAEQLQVTVLVPDTAPGVSVVSLTGRGLALDVRALTEQVAEAGRLGRPFSVTATSSVAVTDCSVEVLAPRRLTLELQRGDDRLQVRVDSGQGVVAGLDELVRRTCRRPRI